MTGLFVCDASGVCVRIVYIKYCEKVVQSRMELWLKHSWNLIIANLGKVQDTCG